MEMRVTVAPAHLLHATLLFLLIPLCASSVLAQSAAIEPCPAPSPSPVTLKPPSTAPSGLSKSGSHAAETLIDSGIAPDAGVEKLLEPYAGKVRALDVVIGRLNGELRTGVIGANSLGNFVTDGIRSAASRKLGKPVVLAITNSGGLRRKLIAAGDIRANDVFELLPFENALIDVELTGAQVLKLLQLAITGRDLQSGAVIHYRWSPDNKPEFIGAKLVDSSGEERSIDPQAIYNVITIDYLLKLGSGSTSAVLQEARKVTPLDETIRDAVLEYVKSETAAGRSIRPRLDGRYVQVGPGPTAAEAAP